MAAKPEHMMEQCDDCSADLEVGQIGKCGECAGTSEQKYEVVIRGFDGATDETDDHILAVEAQMSESEIIGLMASRGALSDVEVISSLPDSYEDIDFRLPEDLDALLARIKEIRRACA